MGKIKIILTNKNVAFIIIIFFLAIISFIVTYRAMMDSPGKRIIHSYLESKGIDIRSGSTEYKTLMRQIVWGDIPELREKSEFIQNQKDLYVVFHYAWKHAGYQQLYGNYQESDVPKATIPFSLPSFSQEASFFTPTSTTIVVEKEQNLSTPLFEFPICQTIITTPKPILMVYLIAEKPMIVRIAPDVEANAFVKIPAGQPFPVLGRYIGWLRIDLRDSQTGWVYGATGLTLLTIDLTQVPTIDLPSPRFVTPTPLCTPQSVQDIDLAIVGAQSTLISFFDLLSKSEYARAVEFYGGEYYVLRNSNPLVDPNDYTTLFQHACEINGYVCNLDVHVINVKVLSPFQFEFDVEFRLSDGRLFIRGPCCGASATQQPPVSRWKYSVTLDCQGRYFVMELPPYIP